MKAKLSENVSTSILIHRYLSSHFCRIIVEATTWKKHELTVGNHSCKCKYKLAELSTEILRIAIPLF